MREFFAISLGSIKSSLRNSGEMFWELIFPMVILFVFTSISFDTTTDLKIYAEGVDIPDGYKTVASPEEADVEIKLKDHTLVIKLRTPDKMKEAMVNSLVWKIKSYLERDGVERSISVESEVLGEGVNYKGYILGGVLVMMIMAAGMFSMIRTLSVYKHEGVLKLFWTTPVRKYVVYSALSISGPVIALISVISALILSRTWGVEYDLDLRIFTGAFAFSLVVSMFIGWILAMAFRTPRAAEGTASLVYTLMPFFSGVYFPVEFLPRSLRWISYLMPTKYMVDLIRKGLGI